jgi:Protein of unknown function (DUF2726)
MELLKTWGLPLAGVLIALLAAAIFIIWRRAAPVAHSSGLRSFRMDDWKPTTMRPLTPRELKMMLHLRKALPECLLLPQIALARFLNVPQSKSYNQWFGSVGRRCVDFLVCSEQGDVLGVIQLISSKKGGSSSQSEGTQRKLKSLEVAQIPVWQIAADPLPDVQNLRFMVLLELQAAEEHSQQHSPESEWQATRLEPRVSKTSTNTNPFTQPKKPAPIDDTRWNQAWPSEDARSSEFLDEFGMIELPPLVVKGSGRSATGFTR